MNLTKHGVFTVCGATARLRSRLSTTPHSEPRPPGSGYAISYDALFSAVLLLGCAVSAGAQAPQPLSVGGKLRFHAVSTVGPGAIVETAAYAGVLHWMDVPSEWGQGASPYGKRVASAAGANAIRHVFAFALDAPLREDPRYQRSGRGNVLARTGHAVRETFLTRTDRGAHRFSTWRFASAYGSAYLSNVWYPDRLNTVSSGIEQGTATIGLDLLGNLASEFWPDIKRKLFRRR